MDPRFTLARHLAKTLGVAAGILALGIVLAWDAQPWEFAALPVVWVIANFFEWGIHRYPMHRPSFPRILYRNHALIHHNAFAGDHQEIASPRELSLVMMPWYTLVMVFVATWPVAAAIMVFAGLSLGGVFFIGSVGYFLLYESIHAVHHLARADLERWPMGRSGVLSFLRGHHHHHHRQERMTHVNFNVTFPLADMVMGTFERSDRSPV